MMNEKKTFMGFLSLNFESRGGAGSRKTAAHLAED
jgi:hypothetical protein